jgi:uncharacterized surface protein with fasciclin (FAS1) repeats
MKTKHFLKVTFLSLSLFITTTIVAQDKNIVETAIATEDFSTLVAALTAADLVDTLSSEGPFTVFAPTNAAFDKLPSGTLESLLKPESKKTLQTILTYHVVAGDIKAKDLIGLIKKNDGKAMVETVSGNMLTAQLKDGNAYLVDENGNWSKITVTDLNQTNGVIHIIDSVVLPK